MGAARNLIPADNGTVEKTYNESPKSSEILRIAKNNASTSANMSQSGFEIGLDSAETDKGEVVLMAMIEKSEEPTKVFRPQHMLETAVIVMKQHFSDKTGAVTIYAVGDDEIRIWNNGIWESSSVKKLQSVLARKLVGANCIEYQHNKSLSDNLKKSVQATNKDGTDYIWPAEPAKVSSLCGAIAMLYRRDDIDEDRPLTHIVTTNGVLSIKKGADGKRQFVDHSPRFPNTWKLPYAYDPEATCPNFDNYLDTITDGQPNGKRFLLEFMGAVVAGKTDLQRAAYLMGVSGSGKSTFAGLLQALAGKMNTAAADGDTGKFTTSSWVGKSLLSFSEMRYIGNPTKFAELILKVVGGDSIPVEGKNKDRKTAKINANVVVCTNIVIPLHDTAGVAHTRFVGMYFNKKIRGTPLEDTDLPAKLAAEMPGILNRALEGLDRLLNNGGVYTVPETHSKVIALLEAASSPLTEVLSEIIVESEPHNVLSTQDVRAAVNAWLERNKTVRLNSGDLSLDNIEAWFKKKSYAKVSRPKDDNRKNHRAIQGVAFASEYAVYRTESSVKAEAARNRSSRQEPFLNP